MYAAFRGPAQRACAHCFSHKQTLRLVTRQTRGFQTTLRLRNSDDPSSSKPPSTTPAPTPAPAPEAFAQNSEEIMRNFEAMFKSAAKETPLKPSRAAKAAAWTQEDFGFGRDVVNYDRQNSRKPNKTRQSNSMRNDRYTAPSYRSDPERIERTEHIEPTTEQSAEQSIEQSTGESTEETSELSPEEQLRLEFRQQRQSYDEETREREQEALVHERAKRFPPSSRPMRREFKSRKQFKGKEMVAWRERFQKMAADGLMFDAQGQPILVPEAEEPELEVKEEETAEGEIVGEEAVEGQPEGEITEGEPVEVPENEDVFVQPEEQSIDNFDEGTFEDPVKRRRDPNEFVPRDQIHFRRPGHRVALFSEPIKGVQILGEPAATIVMRNSKQPQKRDIETIEVDAEHLTIAEMEEQVKTKNLAPEIEEMIANVDELRPSDKVVSYSEFQKLKVKLAGSLTVTNLLAYMDHYDTERALRPHLNFRKPEPVNYTWIQGLVIWEPQWLLTLDHLRKSKEILILNLLVRTWQLRISEEEFGKGTLKVKIASDAISMLLSPVHNMFKTFRTKYLSHGDEFKIHRTTGVLEITATHAVAMTLLDKIDGLVTRMHTGNIPLALFGNRRLTGQEIASLSKITSTWIQQTPEDQANPYVNVSWVEEKDAPRGIESIKHVVTRLAYSSLMPSADFTQTALALPLGVDPENISYILDGSNTKKRGWKNRLGEWVRLVTPVQPKVKTESEAVASETSKAAAELVELELPVTLENALKWPLNTPMLTPEDLTDEWSPLTTRTTAIFGHLLYPRPATAISSCTPVSSLASIPTPSFFTPILPHISSLANIPIDLSSPPSEAHTLILNFTAAPHTLPANHPAGLSPPKLELHISILEDINTITWLNSPKTLLAIHATHTSSVLLPASPVDISLTQHRLQTLAASSLVQNDNLRAFIEASILDLSQGILRTPPAVNLSIPTPGPAALDPSSTSSPPSSPPPTHEYQFLFMGLELRESFASQFCGQRLAHTSIEAGFHGGQRDELSIEPVRVKDSTVDERGYLRSVYAAATGAYFPWMKKLERLARKRPEMENAASTVDKESPEAEVDLEIGVGESRQ